MSQDAVARRPQTPTLRLAGSVARETIAHLHVRRSRGAASCVVALITFVIVPTGRKRRPSSRARLAVATTGFTIVPNRQNASPVAANIISAIALSVTYTSLLPAHTVGKTIGASTAPPRAKSVVRVVDITSWRTVPNVSASPHLTPATGVEATIGQRTAPPS